MLYRKITKDIQEWYQNSSTGLLVDGARQIGKTTIIEDLLVIYLSATLTGKIALFACLFNDLTMI